VLLNAIFNKLKQSNMNSYARKTKENKGQSVANAVSQNQRGDESAFQFVSNRSEAIVQMNLQEISNNSLEVRQLKAIQEMANNKRQVMKFGLGSNVIQARFDDQDLDKMREVARGDQTLTDILNEVFVIHNQMPEDINYGVSSKGGHAALNQEGVGQVVVKDERWALTKKIKNFFNAYGMEHDIERQSMIIHELTHLAELYANLPSNEQGVVPDEHRPQNDRALAIAMEPDSKIVDEIYAQMDEVYDLLEQSDYDDKLKAYLRSRLQYGFAINAENPTVFTEISYYLKAKGKNGSLFFEKISGFANRFYQSRVARRAQR
jgi:hypothetical protein